MKKRERSMTTIWAAVAVGLLIPLLMVQAATRTWDGGGGDSSWINDLNWSDNTEPGPDDSVVIGGTAVVNYDRVSPLVLAGTMPFVTLNDTAQLNLTTGALSWADSNGGAVSLQPGATLNISGGTHGLYGRIGYGQYGNVRVTGSDATINLRQIAGYYGNFYFEFDANGVSTLDYWSYLGIDNANNDLYIDASAYAGGSGHFVLLDTYDGGVLNVFGAANITIIPPSPSWSNRLMQVVGGSDITLELLEAGTIFYDDFYTNGLSSSGVSRDGGWADGTDWAWSSGQMVNAGATKGMGRVVPVPAGFTTESVMELDLNYSVTGASSVVYIHLWGLKDASSTPTTWTMNTGGTIGMWYSAGTAFERCNLGNGSTNFTGYASSAAVQIPASEGVGLSYSGTVNLGSFGAGLSQVSDYDYIAIGFQKSNGSATVKINELSLKARDGEGTLITIR